MPTNSLDVYQLVSPEQVAHEISVTWDRWKNDRDRWEEETVEIRNYIYATDTRTTTNNSNPFMNSTTTPKLTQIAQNLKANYMSHLFSNPDWINWEAANRDSALESKRKSIEAYLRTKARSQNMISTFESILDDWIITGNCFAGMEYVNEWHLDPLTQEKVTTYVGPRLFRISPHDIAFNVAATNWKSAPKIVRSLKAFGDLARDVEEKPNLGYTQELLDKMRNNRISVRNAQAISQADIDKSRGLIADGFSDLRDYYNSDLVEILEFYGDWYDVKTGVFLKNHVITVVDRAFVVRQEPINTWTGLAPIYHSAWRKRPDNLMGMSPLANLVGMQYKIDKLENLRADVFDQIANPTVVEVGDVEFFGVRGAPGQRYVVAEGGAVNFLRPDATALSADLQIAQTMAIMEEMAGAPRESLGFRSPGEKTKFEVQLLDNAANRTFREKALGFERDFLNLILNDMLAMARQNLNGVDIVQMQDSTFGAQQFLEVTREDITATGKLYANGASHFEKQANALQNLNFIFNSQLGQVILPHISKIKLAQVIEDLISSEQFSLVQENIGVLEDIQTQMIAQQGQKDLLEQSVTDGSVEDEEEGDLLEEEQV